MKINCILLAAGNSSRFKGNKLLYNYNGKTLIMNIIEKVKNVDFNEIIVITQYDKIENLALENDLKVVKNEYPEKGQSYSLKLGVLSSEDCDGYMFIACDQPLITLKTLTKMLEVFKHGKNKIICAGFKEKISNPAIFSKQYRDTLLKLEGDIGGRSIIRTNISDVFIYMVENQSELIDIDKEEDLERLQQVE